MTEIQEKSESELQADLELYQKMLRCVKVMKMFGQLLISLPDDFGGFLDQAKLDELAEPRTQELYRKLKNENFSVDDIRGGIEYVRIFNESTVRSCERFTKDRLREINHLLLGFYTPEVDMGIKDIMDTVEKLQKEIGKKDLTPDKKD